MDSNFNTPRTFQNQCVKIEVKINYHLQYLRYLNVRLIELSYIVIRPYSVYHCARPPALHISGIVKGNGLAFIPFQTVVNSSGFKIKHCVSDCRH